MWYNHGILRVFSLTLLAITLLNHTAKADTKPVTIACGARNSTWVYCEKAARAWGKENNTAVQVLSTPGDPQAMMGLFQQQLASASDEVDIYLLDVVMLAPFAPHATDLSSHLTPEEQQAIDPAILNANRQDGQLVGLPYYRDNGFLYYRKDLLEEYGKAVPQTWAELENTAKTIMAGEKAASGKAPYGYVFQGRVSESLVCNTIEWLAGANSTAQPLDIQAQGLDTKASRAMLGTVQRWMGTITPTAVLNYNEEDSRAAFQSGNAVFMRNWTYAWALMQASGSPVAGKTGIAPLPRAERTGKSYSTLGGWSLMVSRYSTRPDKAIALAKALASPENQRDRAENPGLQPTIPAVLASLKNPSAPLALLQQSPFTLALRPSPVTGGTYNPFSVMMANTVHDVLRGKEVGKTTGKAIRELEKRR